jgi:hypothetical protein
MMGSMLGDARTADISLHSDGVVIVRIHPGTHQTVENANANLSGAIEARGGERRPILVDISQSEPLDAEIRHRYTGPTLAAAFTAVGLLVEASPFGHMIGNIYLRIARLSIPVRLFVKEEAALAWLRKFRG